MSSSKPPHPPAAKEDSSARSRVPAPGAFAMSLPHKNARANMTGRKWFLLLAVLLVPCGTAAAQEARQSLDDAWWTGPMLANSAHTLPRGHLLVESYIYDAVQGKTDSINSLTYLLYGLTDRITLGLVPTGGVNLVRGAPGSSGFQWGDTQLRAQIGLTAMDAERGIPDLAIALIQNLPTGRHDRLSRLSDGFGAGTASTALALYSQMAFWLPNGRLLRTRFNLQRTFAAATDVRDMSVYGTASGFRGKARTGASFQVDAAFEYSLTRSWVLAADVIYNHADATAVDGLQNGAEWRRRSGTSDGWGIAPAIEYSWTPDLGVLAGVRILMKGHNSPASVTPAVAINYVL